MTTLGEHALDWCLREQHAGTPGIAKLAGWFELAGRGLEGMVLAGQKLNHCAIAQSAALRAGLEEMGLPFDWEHCPHGMRAGAKQLMHDAIMNHRWHAASEAVSGVWSPSLGDLAIYDRSQPGRPETAWWGHVDRVVRTWPDYYSSVGANEGPGGAWRYDTDVPFSHPKLLGFIAYPRPEPDPPRHLLSVEEITQVKSMVALTLDQSEARWWENAREETV